MAMSFQSLAVYYRVGKSTVNRRASETCTAIWSVLKPTYTPVPSKNYWLDVSARYLKRTNFLCIDVGTYGTESDSSIF
jgi:hypothetical protein